MLLSGILFLSWRWSRSSKRGINVGVVPTSGYPVRAPWESRTFVQNARVPIGTSRANINSRRGNSDLSKGLAERQGVEPTVLTHRSEFLRPLATTSDVSPLNGHGNGSRTRVSGVGFRRPGPLDDAVVYDAGGEYVSKRLAPHSAFQQSLFLPRRDI
jgi:hypothetical protein